MSDRTHSMADQKARVARAHTENNTRFLDIDTVYKPAELKGLRVVVTGANRGLGFQITKELVAAGALVVAACRSTCADLDAAGVAEIVTDVDVTSDSSVAKFAEQVAKGGNVDIVINNAGYFYGPKETVDSLNFSEQLKQIDVCGLGPLRISSALFNKGLLKEGSRVVIITSQAGSVEWRFTQNPEGGDYGHHMSRAACNMAGVLLAQELKTKGVAIGLLHPGFNRTEMTRKYEAIWDEEGAVEPRIGARRVLHEILALNIARTAVYVNCEDGLVIPW